MKNSILNLLDKLNQSRSLTLEEYEALILGYSPEVAEYAAKLAVEERKKVYGTDLYEQEQNLMGLVEYFEKCGHNLRY